MGSSDSRWLSAAEMDAWVCYFEATHLFERRVEEQLQVEAGLSHAQYEVLVRLAAAPERRMRMSELARQIVISRSGTTYQVTQMERRGLVCREACPSDSRGVLAVLTNDGARTLERTAPGHVAVVRAHLIDLLAPEELRTLTRVMTAVRDRLVT